MNKKIIFLSILLFLVLTKAAHAAGPNLNLTVSPSALEVADKPGNKIEGKFRLRNNTTSPIDLTLKVDTLNADQNGNITPGNTKQDKSYLSWLTFDQPTIHALPQEWTTINYTLTIPQDASFAYYYAIHIAQNDTLKTANTKVLGEVIIPLLLTVNRDGEVKQSKLVSFTTIDLSEYLPINFSTTIENQGNVHLKPRGNIFIRDSRNKDIAILDVNQNLGSILPGSKRTFMSSWDDGFLVKRMSNETGKTYLEFNWNKLTDFRFGKYTANLIMVYDNGKRDVALEAATTFWVIPYNAFGVIILSFIIIFFILRLILKLYIKNQVKKLTNKN